MRASRAKGSEFIVDLCFALSGRKVGAKQIPQLEGLRALVADDDTDTCLSISTMLSKIGMRPEWTSPGREAIDRTRYAMEQGDEFSVYIIDWLIPDMNGIEVVRQIRQGDWEKLPHHHSDGLRLGRYRRGSPRCRRNRFSAKSRYSFPNCAECWQNRLVQSLSTNHRSQMPPVFKGKETFAGGGQCLEP